MEVAIRVTTKPEGLLYWAKASHKYEYIYCVYPVHKNFLSKENGVYAFCLSIKWSDIGTNGKLILLGPRPMTRLLEKKYLVMTVRKGKIKSTLVAMIQEIWDGEIKKVKQFSAECLGTRQLGGLCSSQKRD